MEVNTRDESKGLLGDTLIRGQVFEDGEKMHVQGNQAHIVSRKPAQRTVLRICNRQGGSRYVRSTRNLVS